MAQLFTARASAAFRVALALVPLTVVAAGVAAYAWSRSDGYWNVGVPAPQPIPFRHDLHSGALRIDCRHCHASAERAARAGMPSAEACLTCHSQVWAGASVLEPLATSVALRQPIVWTSVHRLPSWAYFHHGIHVAKGVACETCHGRVDRMPQTMKAETLSMSWCLDCHRDPVSRLRPREAVTAMGWQAHDAALPADLRAFYEAAAPRLTSCSTCHR